MCLSINKITKIPENINLREERLKSGVKKERKLETTLSHQKHINQFEDTVERVTLTEKKLGIFRMSNKFQVRL